MKRITTYSRRMRGALAVFVTMAALVLSASPAEASGTYSGRAYIYGGGTWVGDWGDEGDLSTSTNTYSNATCLWQKILWADGLLSASDIDGIYGSKTKAQTLYWQEMNELSDLDGIAGKETFGKADDSLYRISQDSDGNITLQYIGIYYKPYFIREADGNYGFYDGTNTYRLAGYNYRTCS
ncbi:peptidoglycan-binding domain-containing protein [Streptomyces sp. CA-249302]|uniref:peptidoglycan-binding domain-containing protein n=1 Tax=Streptomyces sp. CA-249302 TaxID=3240058 RepID=UPI003D9469A9